MKRAVDRYVESLLNRRRPRPFAPNEDDLAVTRTAIALAAAGPDGHGPGVEFVEELRRKITAQHAAEAPRPGSAESAEVQGITLGMTPGMAPGMTPEVAPKPVRAVPARRRFLQATALTAGAAAAGAAADHLVTRPAGRSPVTAQGELTPVRGSWQTVLAAADLPEGGVLPFDLGTVVGFVQRTSGRVQAVSGICTHQGCRLNLATPPKELVCPCHGATFTVSGEPLTYPHSTYAAAPLPRLAVRVQEGSIQVYAPTPGGAPST